VSSKELTSRELRKLSHAAAGLYRATNYQELGRRIFSLVGEALPVAHSTTWDIGLQSLRQSLVYSDPAIEKAALASLPVYEHYTSRYPALSARAMNPMNRGKVIKRTEILSHSLLGTIGFLDEFAKPNGCEFQLVYYFRSEADRLCVLTCNRNGRNFTDREEAILQFLAPHLQSAFENATEFETRERSFKKSDAVRQKMPFETIWLDDDLKVKEISPLIPTLIREFFQEDFLFNQLPGRLMDWLQTASPVRAEVPPRPLTLRTRDACLKVRFYPQQLPGLHLLTFHRRLIRPTLEIIKPLGLTRRESEVLLWVAQGKTNDEIARVLGCSRRTVSKHMENLLQKLHMENRSGAMLLVNELLQG